MNLHIIKKCKAYRLFQWKLSRKKIYRDSHSSRHTVRFMIIT